MTTVSTDQGLVLQVGTDPANEPGAETSYNAGVEPRLVLRYTNLADRTARHPSLVDGELSYLQDVNRAERSDGTNWVSELTAAHYTYVRMAADASLTQSNTTLQSVTALVSALPTAGTFGFRLPFFYDSSTTADLKVAFLIPAGATMLWGICGIATGAAGTSADGQFATASASDSAIAIGGAGVNTVLAAVIEGEITMGGTAGNLQFWAAQNTSDATQSTIRTRSRLQVWRSA